MIHPCLHHVGAFGPEQGAEPRERGERADAWAGIKPVNANPGRLETLGEGFMPVERHDGMVVDAIGKAKPIEHGLRSARLE